MDGIAPPFTSWKPVVILLYDIRMKDHLPHFSVAS